MARHPGFNTGLRYVFHPRLTKAQKDFILRAKERLDDVRVDLGDDDAAINGLSVWFAEPMGFWTYDGTTLKTRTCRANVWFYGVTWTATFNHFGDVSRAITYSIRWSELDKQVLLPTAPSGKGKTRLKERAQAQKEVKRDNRRRQKRAAKADGEAGAADTGKARGVRRRKRRIRKSRG